MNPQSSCSTVLTTGCTCIPNCYPFPYRYIVATVLLLLCPVAPSPFSVLYSPSRSPPYYHAQAIPSPFYYPFISTLPSVYILCSLLLLSFSRLMQARVLRLRLTS